MLARLMIEKVIIYSILLVLYICTSVHPFRKKYEQMEYARMINLGAMNGRQQAAKAETRAR